MSAGSSKRKRDVVSGAIFDRLLALVEGLYTRAAKADADHTALVERVVDLDRQNALQAARIGDLERQLGIGG